MGAGACGLLSPSGLLPAVPLGPASLSLPAAREGMEVRGPQGPVHGPGSLWRVPHREGDRESHLQLESACYSSVEEAA